MNLLYTKKISTKTDPQQKLHSNEEIQFSHQQQQQNRENYSNLNFCKYLPKAKKYKNFINEFTDLFVADFFFSLVDVKISNS